MTKPKRYITVKEFMRQVKILKIPKNATIYIYRLGGWRKAESLSFCRPLGEISVW